MFMFGVMPIKIRDYNRTYIVCTHTLWSVLRASIHYIMYLVNPFLVGLVRAILAGCKDFLWESNPRGPGLKVKNAFTGEDMLIWLVIIRLVEDSVGLPKPLCCHKQPAFIGLPHTLLKPDLCAHLNQRILNCSLVVSYNRYNPVFKVLLTSHIIIQRLGACPWCNLEGIRCGRTTAYPSALALVPARSPARALWKNYKPGAPIDESESSDTDDEQAPANNTGAAFDCHVEAIMKKGIAANTSAGALASGTRAARMATKTQRKREPFYGVSVYSALFEGTLHASHYLYTTLLFIHDHPVIIL
jgi:hypothetical protein